MECAILLMGKPMKLCLKQVSKLNHLQLEEVEERLIQNIGNHFSNCI